MSRTGASNPSASRPLFRRALLAAAWCLLAGSLPGADDAGREPAIRAANPVQAAIDDAIRSGTARLAIPAGTYRIPPGDGAAQIVVSRADGLEIDGTGATLVFTARDRRGFSLRDCRRVTVRGFRFERAVPTCAQGRIERIEEDGRWCTVRLDRGYPLDVDDRRYFPTCWPNLFTPDGGRWTSQYRGVTPTEMQRLAPDLVRIRMSVAQAQVPVPLAIGTPLAWRGADHSDLDVRDSTDCTIDSVVVAGGAGMCFHERGGGGNRYLGCAVVKAAKPAGATAEPLLASCADGFHSSGTTRGPRLERCSFTAVDDDAIAIHGTYAMVVEVRSASVVAWVLPWEENALYGAPGDRLRLYDARRIAAGEAVASAFAPLAGYRLAASPDPSFAAFGEPAKGRFVEIAFAGAGACRPGWLLSNPACAGPGYVIRDCVIRDTCARGILAKGAGGLIEGNRIERTARAGIEFNPELSRWSEDDYASGTIVRGNTLREVGLNRMAGELRHPGALAVFAWHGGAYVPAPGGHRDLLISGNAFIDNDGPNLLIASAQGIRIEGNSFVRPMRTLSNFGRDKGVDPRALVWIGGCDGVAASGNRVEAPGPGMSALCVGGPPGLAAGFATAASAP